MQQRQRTSTRSRLRRKSANRGEFLPGKLTTAMMVGVVLLLVTVTFVADWLRTPEIALLASTPLLSPNGDGDQDLATFSYRLSEEADVTIQLVSERGGVVRTLLFETPQDRGQHTVTWDGLNELGQPVADGSYRLEITASGAIREAQSSASTNVDTVPPNLQLLNLPNGLRVRDTNLTVEGVADPDATVLITGDPQPVVVDNRGQFSFPYRLREGTNQLEVLASDSAGNTTAVSREIVLVTTPPEVEIISPLDDSWTNQPVTTVTGRVSPNVTLTLNQEPVAVGNDGTFRHQILLDEGTNIIRAVATDDVGNETLSEILVHTKTTPPALSVNVQEGETLSTPVLQLSGSTDPGSTVQINGQTIPVGSTGSFQMGLQLSEGVNIIDIEARDQAGNIAQLTRQVRYEMSGPPSGLERVLRNLEDLPLLAIPAVLAGGLFVAFLLFRQRGISMTLAVDQQVFAPGLPGEGKVVLVWLDLNRTTRVTLEVLDHNGYPIATILRDRRRTARKHTFSWDGYDDFGRPLPPGEYTLQAEAGVPPVTVTTSLPIRIEEDILVHRRRGRGKTVGLARGGTEPKR